MNTDTPKTNQAVLQSDGQWSFVLRGCSQELERELTAAREEIDMLGIRYAAAEMHHENNRQEIIDQRDRLAEAIERYIAEDYTLVGPHRTLAAVKGGQP